MVVTLSSTVMVKKFVENVVTTMTFHLDLIHSSTRKEKEFVSTVVNNNIVEEYTAQNASLGYHMVLDHPPTQKI